MTQVQIDPILEQKLGGFAAPVELRDASGKPVGHFLPEAEYRRLLYASFKNPLSDEEIARRRSETGAVTLDQIWKDLGRT